MFFGFPAAEESLASPTPLAPSFVLCAPVQGRAGRILGVVQVLSTKKSHQSTEGVLARLCAALGRAMEQQRVHSPQHGQAARLSEELAKHQHLDARKSPQTPEHERGRNTANPSGTSKDFEVHGGARQRGSTGASQLEGDTYALDKALLEQKVEKFTCEIEDLKYENLALLRDNEGMHRKMSIYRRHIRRARRAMENSTGEDIN